MGAILSIILDIFNDIFNFVDAVVQGFFNPPIPEGGVSIENQAVSRARADIQKNEGFKTTAYRDSLGFLTIGYGHKITVMDGIFEGDEISIDQVNRFLDNDLRTATAAAIPQARETRYTVDFLAALIEVNFQLGTGWRSKFPNTWQALKNGDYTTAINNLLTSSWNKQTPKRVAAFVSAIQSTYA